MRWVTLAVLGFLLAGCQELPSDGTTPSTAPATAGPCPLPPVNLSGMVTEVRESSLLVDARGSLEGPVILHIGEETTLLVRDGLSCRPGRVADVHPGDSFEAVADGPVMESYPPQTTPSTVFLDRPR